MYQIRPEDRLDDTPEYVTAFTHYSKNPQTTVPFQEYEENEAPPPGLDKHSKERTFKNGQFLNKN